LQTQRLNPNAAVSIINAASQCLQTRWFLEIINFTKSKASAGIDWHRLRLKISQARSVYVAIIRAKYAAPNIKGADMLRDFVIVICALFSPAAVLKLSDSISFVAD
jgi:hypothetical protein